VAALSVRGMTHIKHGPIRSALTAVAGSLAVAALATGVPTAAYAHHGGPEIFPAYYDDTVVSFLMGPSGNSQNPHQAPGGCFGLGPDMADTSRHDDVPVMYTIFVPEATQMSCAGGVGMHDMVLTAVPGDPGYQPAVRIRRCLAGPNYATADFPFTSAAEVEAAIAAGQLVCTPPGPIRLASVVGRPTSGMRM